MQGIGKREGGSDLLTRIEVGIRMSLVGTFNVPSYQIPKCALTLRKSKAKTKRRMTNGGPGVGMVDSEVKVDELQSRSVG